jgi:hypothetical protein
VQGHSRIALGGAWACDGARAVKLAKLGLCLDHGKAGGA